MTVTADLDSDAANRALIEAFFAASERGDGAAAAALMHDEMVMTWPPQEARARFRDPA